MVAQVDSDYRKISLPRYVRRLFSYALFEGRPLTTKGRWINPFLFSLYRCLGWLPRFKEVKKPVFIIGTGRSGTTILGVVFSMHRDVGFLNEPKALWASVCDFEDVIGSYSKKPAKYLMAESDATPRARKKLGNLYSYYQLLTGTSTVLDKYPELVFRVPFVKSLFPDAKFLFLHRNGWDTCDSIDKWSKRKGVYSSAESHDWWGDRDKKWIALVEQVVSSDDALAPYSEDILAIKDHRLRAAVEWVLVMKAGMALQQQFPDDVIAVSYEKFAEQPRQELSFICQKLDLAEDEPMLSYAEQVMKPAAAKESFPLPTYLEVEFQRVMRMLGYEGE